MKFKYVILSLTMMLLFFLFGCEKETIVLERDETIIINNQILGYETKDLYITGPFTLEYSKEIQRLPNLEHLEINIDEKYLTDTKNKPFYFLKNCPLIDTLSIEKINDDLFVPLKELQKYPQIKNLTLYNANEGYNFEELSNLEFDILKILNLDDLSLLKDINNINSLYVTTLKGISSLNGLDIQYVYLFDLDPNYLNELKSLSTLKMLNVLENQDLSVINSIDSLKDLTLRISASSQMENKELPSDFFCD